ncbi:copper chaperone [Mucilaginibacter limnophilus]|uniref:Copper chaperone n=1 Tax=Mucilaginibacter limnophilus TaxID=1932778 RepID=A0A437MRI6_9SPHI|nr:heavy-metal-associated domain-containing protein [Mucilaginibacter limnophilus]RVU00259.1 copper chaperone [Mucilaginibacter limnophilus]
MKSLKIFLAIAAFTFAFTKANAQFIKAELQVSGLTCSMCSKATEKSLRTLDFISDIKPDLNRNIFNITFKNNVPVNFEKLNNKVQTAGFSVNILKATYNFNNTTLNNDMFNYSGYSFHLVNAGNKSLNGPVALTFVDKGFAPATVAKKYSGMKPASPGAKKVYCVVI